jgi:hypothetical protein
MQQVRRETAMFLADLQPRRGFARSFGVERCPSNVETMTSRQTRHFVRAAPPPVHAGLGRALRRAFPVDRDPTLQSLENLLAQID